MSSIDVRSLIKAWFSVYPGFFRSGVKESFKALLTSPRLEELVSNGFKISGLFADFSMGKVPH